MASLDAPLVVDLGVERARRRAKQKRLLVPLLAIALVAAGAGAVALTEPRSATQAPAKLTVLAVGTSGRAVFHLRCDPAGGNVAQPAKACAAIAAQPSLVTDPKPFYCIGGTDGVWYFTISGRLNGKAVRFAGESCWTPQMALIGKLGLAGSHGQPLGLVPRRHGFIREGQTRTFAPGVLRPGDLVTCRVPQSYKGPRLAMSVPIHRGFGNMLGAQPGVIDVRVRADGAVIASCLARDRMPLDKRGRTTLPAGWPPL